MKHLILLPLVICAAAAQQQGDRENPGVGPDPRVSSGPIAPKLSGLGNHHFPVTTKSAEAQEFFDQGLALSYAFNHAEALRAFEECARLDPECAMAYWGQAFVRGPNLNRMMQDDDIAPAYAAVQKAVALAPKASEKEQAFIKALAARYAPDNTADRAALNQAYAAALLELRRAYPDDVDAAVLYADALMNLNPWNYWTNDARPRPNTLTILETLDWAIAKEPDHAGAHHAYIHAVEAHKPELAVPSAERLGKITPGAGHLVHMPAHIFMRVGRYEDAAESNRLAILADEGYLTECRQQGIYPLAYYPHNIHFLAWAAERKGASAEAIEAARKVGNKAREAKEVGADFGLHQAFYAFPYHVMARLGKWEMILQEPAPARDAPYARASWHYARGLAYVFTGQVRKAAEELKAIEAAMESDAVKQEFVGYAAAVDNLRIAHGILAGEIAAAKGDYDRAVLLAEQAVRIEDGMAYNEPPDWPTPTRHYLGAILMDAGRPRDAEIVYWADLRRNPDNGYALFGLWKALEAQGKTEEAADAHARFTQAWSEADFELTSSRN